MGLQRIKQGFTKDYKRGSWGLYRAFQGFGFSAFCKDARLRQRRGPSSEVSILRDFRGPEDEGTEFWVLGGWRTVCIN